MPTNQPHNPTPGSAGTASSGPAGAIRYGNFNVSVQDAQRIYEQAARQWVVMDEYRSAGGEVEAQAPSHPMQFPVFEKPAVEDRPPGRSIQTFSGKRVWPLDPRPYDISIFDICHALGMKCRFTGQCAQFYSIAEHSVLLSHCVSPENALWALLHDASEAYLPDVASPIKCHIPTFVELEENVQVCIAQVFNLPWPIPREVHEWDKKLYRYERNILMTRDPLPSDEPPLPVSLRGYGPNDSVRQMKHRFTALTGHNF